MTEVLAQATAALDLVRTIGLLLILAVLGALLVTVVSWWALFNKAGRPGWAALVPIYNVYTLVKVAGLPGWWLLLLLVPIVNIAVMVLLSVDVAKSFGKGTGFGIGLLVLGVLFYPILAFGDSRYVGLADDQHALPVAIAKLEPPVRSFEWTWTKAIVFSLGFTFVILISTVVLPSFWMYFAEGEIGWGGPTDIQAFFEELRHPWNVETGKEVRDAIAMGLTTMPIIVAFVVCAAMQNWRRKLRGAAGQRPTGGYR